MDPCFETASGLGRAIRNGRLSSAEATEAHLQRIARINGAVVDTLADPTVRQRLTDLGQVIATRDQQTPKALAAYHKAEIEKWWPIIKAAGLKAE